MFGLDESSWGLEVELGPATDEEVDAAILDVLLVFAVSQNLVTFCPLLIFSAASPLVYS